jgi:hypothetical protein
MKYYKLTKELRDINNPIRLHPLLFVDSLNSRLSAYKLARALDEVIKLHRPIELICNTKDQEGFGTTKINSIFYTRFVKELKKRGWLDHEVEHKLQILTHFDNQEYLTATVRKQLPDYYDTMYETPDKKFRRSSTRQRVFKL